MQTDENQFMNQVNINMSLENLIQQELLVKLYLKVKLLQKKRMKINQIYQIRLMNLIKKQDRNVIKKNKKEKLLKKTCIIFLKQGKWFLMALKAKYF